MTLLADESVDRQIVERLAGLSPDRKAALVAVALREHGEELKGAFSVISIGHVRIRRRLD